MRPAAPGRSPSQAPTSADPDDLKTTAIELEERSLEAQAARAWRAYLEAEPETSERAEILYRIGTLYMAAEQFDEAAAALVQSELAAGSEPGLKSKIGPKLVECLRRLGRYGEVGRELSRQVEAGADQVAKGNVLATLAGEPLTEADVDRMIERQVDRLLAVQGTPQDEAARQAVLRQFSNAQARRQMLQELLQTELFCRRARELKLDQEDEFLQARQHLEQSLLASRFLARQLEKIRPTDVDLQSYYKANQDRYREPESAEVRLIELGAEEDVAALLETIKSADDFRKLASERRSPDAPDGEAPPPRAIQRGRVDPLLGDVEKLFELSEGQWTTEPHVNGDQKHLVLVEKKTPARVPPLSEVRRRVEADYSQIKRQELTEQLFRDLLTRYDVRIMPPGGDDEGAKKSGDDEAKSADESPKADDRSAQADKEQTP